VRRLTGLKRCALLLLSAWVTADAGESQGYRVYVTNEGSGDLTVIDGQQRNLVATVPLGKRPRGIVAASDGHWLYVALSGSPLAPPGVDESALPPPDRTADGIAVVDAASGRIDHVIRAISDPEQVAVDGVRSRLYVAGEDTGRVAIVDLRTGAVLARRDVGGQPEGVAVHPQVGIAAVTSEVDNTVSLLDTRSHRVLVKMPVGRRPRDAAFTPEGRWLLVSGELDASLTVIDVAKRRVVRRLRVPGDGARPKGIAISGDGQLAFVTTGRGGELVRLDLRSWQFTGSVRVGQRPWGVALSPDAALAFTANGPSNDISVVDTREMDVVATVPVGNRPWGVAVAADQ
jgi:YVTN family beta-propeller protein